MLDIKLRYTTVPIGETGPETAIAMSGCCYINPKYRNLFTPEIERWINNYFDQTTNGVQIIDGKAITLFCISQSNCMPGDKFDKCLGEKIARSKSKIKIYHFMKNLCDKIISEFMLLLNGHDFVTTISPNRDSIFADYIKYQDLETEERIYLKKLINK